MLTNLFIIVALYFVCKFALKDTNVARRVRSYVTVTDVTGLNNPRLNAPKGE